MDLLFELLGSTNTKVVNDIWELLSFLPVNRNLKGLLEKLNIDSEEAWNKILDISCTRKLLYCLQIVNDLSGAAGYFKMLFNNHIGMKSQTTGIQTSSRKRVLLISSICTSSLKRKSYLHTTIVDVQQC